MKKWCVFLVCLMWVGSTRAVTVTTSVDGVSYAELASFARDISASYLLEGSTIKLKYQENAREKEVIFDIESSTIKIDSVNYTLTNKTFRKADSFYGSLRDIEILIGKTVKTKEIPVINLEVKRLEIGKVFGKTLSQNEIYRNQIAIKTHSLNIYQALKRNASSSGSQSVLSVISSTISANFLGKFQPKDNSMIGWSEPSVSVYSVSASVDQNNELQVVVSGGFSSDYYVSTNGQ